MQKSEFGWSLVVPPYFYEVKLIGTYSQVKTALEDIGRIGQAPDREVTQVAHLLRKRGKFFVCHFKSLLMLDGKTDKESIKPHHLDELTAALILLYRRGLIEYIDSYTCSDQPTRIVDVADLGGTWKKLSKYTFKTPH